MAIRGRFLLDRGFDLVDGPGGSEAAGGVAANAYGDFVAFAGLCVAQGGSSRGYGRPRWYRARERSSSTRRRCRGRRRRRGDKSTAGAAAG